MSTTSKTTSLRDRILQAKNKTELCALLREGQRYLQAAVNARTKWAKAAQAACARLGVKAEELP